ncbi:MAG TPA: insulinase family protein [Kofleriaceae bacterium]|nr:insulinase family protein [Kofleriaceae bacterium]
MRRSAVLLVVLVGCGGPRPPSRLIRFESTAHTAELRNGLRVLVVEDHTTNLVQLAVRVDAGSASDPPGKSGLAHLAEHLMFQVESEEDARPVGAELSAIAIAFNAVTTWEATQFVTMARADQVDRLIALEGRRFASRCESISAGTFEREREVVRNERRLHSGAFGGDVEQLIRHIYPPDHPYARPVVGRDAELSRLTLGDVCAFVAAHYRPEHMVMVLTGDVAARPAIGMVRRHMGSLHGHGPAPRWQPSYPRLTGARRTARGDFLAAGESAVVIAWPLPPAYSREQAAASIAMALVQSELSREDGPGGVVMELGEARAPVAVAVIRLGARGRPDTAGTGRVLAAVARAVDRAAGERNEGIIEPLVNRQSRELLADFDQLSSRVQRLAEGFQVGGRAHLFADELLTLTRLRPADVQRAARRVFSRERAVVVEVEPGGAPGRAAPEPPRVSYAGKSHDDAWTAPVDASEASHPLRVPLPRSMLNRAERLRLANGLEVILLRTPTVPLLRAQLVFAGGSADDPPGREGEAFLAAHALDFKASRAFDAAAYKALSRFGDDLEVRVDADRTAFAVKGLSSHLDAVLAGLASLVEDGRYSDDLLDTFRRFRLSRQGGGGAAGGGRGWFEQYVAMRRTLYGSVFGAGHPYARAAGLGLPGPSSRFSHADLELVRSRRFGSQNGVLIVTGNFDPALAREHVEHWFADLRPGEAHAIARPPPAAPAGRTVLQLATAPAEPTMLVEIAYPTRQEPRMRAVRMVVARMLRERMARVRDVLGAAYRVSASHEDNLGPSMFLVSAAVDARRADEALVTMLGELARLRAGAAPDLAEAFVRARREVLYTLLAEESGADSAGARIAALVEQGESLGGEQRLAREIMALTVDDLEPVLAADLSSANETIALLGPPDSIRAARRAAGL